jgi:2,3-bisphosphoglycerate-dependent phosphoglycerate mutase
MEFTRAFLIRHGQTDWNAGTRIQGQLDIGLNAVGVQQAEQTGQALSDEVIDHVIASDLARARVTAEHIAKPHGLQVRTDRGLRERHFGSFQGRTFAQIESENPDDAMQWRKRVPEFQPGGAQNGGESLLAFHARVVACASALCRAHLGENIVLVAHGGVLDVLHREATKVSLQAPRTWGLDNAAINQLLWTPDSGFSLVRWNDVSHLDSSLDETSA